MNKTKSKSAQKSPKSNRDIDPRISELGISAIPLAGNTHVLTVDIPPSVGKPHQAQDARFLGVRHASENEPLKVGQLRGLFVGAVAVADAFRCERVDQFLAGKDWNNLGKKGAIMLHVLPLSHWPSKRLPLHQTLDNESFAFCLDEHKSIHYGDVGEYKFNCRFQRVEHRTVKEERPHWDHNKIEYVPYFRQVVFADGAVEFVVPNIFDQNGTPVLSSKPEWREYNHIKLHCKKILRGFAELEISPPFCIMVSVLGVSNSVLEHDRHTHTSEGRYCKEERLLLHPFIPKSQEISAVDAEMDAQFKQWLDDIANAYGRPKWPQPSRR